ncbi:reverse transcriptase domain-containing protein [Tanacetum coccineum]
MRTRNSYFPNKSNVTIPRCRNKGRAPNIVEPELLTIVAPMAERTMEELLRAPTEGYREAIVLLEINADHFDIKTNLLQLVQANPFYGRESENPHAHINSLKRFTSTLRFSYVPNDVIKLMMFPYSLEGAAKTCLNYSGTLPSNTIPNPKGEMKAITTRSVFAYRDPRFLLFLTLKKGSGTRNRGRPRDKEQIKYSKEYRSNPTSLPKNYHKPNLHIQSCRDDQKSRDKASNQMEKIFQIFQDLRFDISFADALLLMTRFAPRTKSLLMNKEKLLELAKIPLNENRSAMLLKKLPEKLGYPGKFLIPSNFPGIDACHALADLGASINLMPLSIWKKLSLPDLTPTRMTLELADGSITYPKGLAKDVFVKVGKFQFPTDFVVVDFEADPRVPLILGRSFLRTGRALIKCMGEEIPFGCDNEPHF